MNLHIQPKITLHPSDIGYIAGMGDGIASLHGKGVRRYITVFDVATLAVVQQVLSHPSGRYLIANLDVNKRYLVMLRPLVSDGVGVAPCVWDNVKPESNLSFDEQKMIWTGVM